METNVPAVQRHVLPLHGKINPHLENRQTTSAPRQVDIYLANMKKVEKEQGGGVPLILSQWKKVNLLQLLFNLRRWTLKPGLVPNKSHAWLREKVTDWRCAAV